MTLSITSIYIISGISVVILGIFFYIIRNLLVKVERYEDVVQDQTQYLQNISNLVGDSQKHLKTLDEKGVFQSDDEVGYFFDNLKKVQENFDQYQLSDNYAPKKIQS